MELYYIMAYKLNLMKTQRKLGNVNNRLFYQSQSLINI